MIAADPVRFYFEFSSPYSYLASLGIDAAVEAPGRSVSWRPIDLPVVWRTQNVLEPYLAVRKLKVSYIWRDAQRCAERMGVQLLRPASGQPGDTALAKCAYWGLCETDDNRAKPFLQAVWRRYFAEGGEIVTLGGLTACVAELGLTASDIEAAAALPQSRARQEASNSEAIATRCFGVPWFVVGDEAFWGHDRIPHLVDHIGSLSRAAKR